MTRIVHNYNAESYRRSLQAADVARRAVLEIRSLIAMTENSSRAKNLTEEPLVSLSQLTLYLVKRLERAEKLLLKEKAA